MCAHGIMTGTQARHCLVPDTAVWRDQACMGEDCGTRSRQLNQYCGTSGQMWGWQWCSSNQVDTWLGSAFLSAVLSMGCKRDI